MRTLCRGECPITLNRVRRQREETECLAKQEKPLDWDSLFESNVQYNTAAHRTSYSAGIVGCHRPIADSVMIKTPSPTRGKAVFRFQGVPGYGIFVVQRIWTVTRGRRSCETC